MFITPVMLTEELYVNSFEGYRFVGKGMLSIFAYRQHNVSLLINELRLMRLFNLLLVFAALSLLNGCAENSGKSEFRDSSSVTTPPDQNTSAEPVGDSSDTGLASDIRKGIQSVYTDLNLDDCEILRTFEEEGGVELQCAGYQGISLFVSEGDLRFDIDVGVSNDKWTTQSPFNTLGEKVEWRLRDGKPFAAIVRYHVDDGSGTPLPSVLAVLTVGRTGSPGCLVGWVPADAKPSQNEAARQLADKYAENFDCSTANE